MSAISKRKVQELLLAIWLEHHLSKDEILALYLNRVYFGAGAYGVDAAARRYFGKPATEVSLAEAALLAGLLKAPSRYAPTVNPGGARRRAAAVLKDMVEAGFIDRPRADAALAQPAALTLRPALRRGRHFADWVRDQLPDYLGGHSGADLAIATTLDLDLQGVAETVVAEQMARARNEEGVDQVALVAMSGGGARPGDGRRPRLRRQQLQPGDRRAAAAGVGVQALRVSRGAGERPRAGQPR